jgi:hypothetical protein
MEELDRPAMPQGVRLLKWGWGYVVLTASRSFLIFSGQTKPNVLG